MVEQPTCQNSSGWARASGERRASQTSDTGIAYLGFVSVEEVGDNPKYITGTLWEGGSSVLKGHINPSQVIEIIIIIIITMVTIFILMINLNLIL